MSRAAAGPASEAEVPESVYETLRRSGHPLEEQTRQFMESRFGHDFSGVRVHTGGPAARSVRDVSARAYTVGRDVVFGAGEYSPRTSAGRQLLAHELTHVVQQSSGADSRALEIGPPDTEEEKEADQAAREVAGGGHANVGASRTGAMRVARQQTGTAGGGPAQPTEVTLIRISCESDTIEFETDVGVYIYSMTSCSLPDALDYMATVTIEPGFLRFSDPPGHPDAFVRFRFRIRRDQPNPKTFFESTGQTAVHIVTGTVNPSPMPGPTPGPNPPTPALPGPPSPSPPEPGRVPEPTPGPTPELGPGPGRSIQVCSRPLDVPRWTGGRKFQHAFISDPPKRYAIRNLLAGNGVTESCAEKTDASGPPDDPAASVCKPCLPAPGQSLGDLSARLAGLHGAYASPNRYRNLPDRSDGWRWGPNSNSYAAHLASCCHNFSRSGLGILPGWNHSPAGPCTLPLVGINPPPNGVTPDTGTPQEVTPDAGVPNDGAPRPAGVDEPAAAPACGPVAPGGAPTVRNPAPDNAFQPATRRAVIDWDVTSADAANWAPCVTSLSLSAEIRINPWASDPTHMVVPNTPNPVDGGNINNTTGSNNHWQYAIDDMADYDNAVGGGAGRHWHSTEASEAHEWAHWHEDYKSDAVSSAAGGNWAQVNTDINALREPKASSPTPVDARTALTPTVDALINQWVTAVIRRWNVIVNTTDKPGGGGRGYAAGMAVLNRLISAVRAYKASKGW